MEAYAWFLLPAVILLGVITSYTDIKHGTIRNKWILIFFLYGVLVYIGYFFYSFYTEVSPLIVLAVGVEKIEYSLFIQVISNFFLSLACGATIWIFHMWSAADAKLFIVYSFLLPLHFYTTDFIRYFPGVIIAINAIVLIVFFLFIEALRKNFANCKESLKETLVNPKELLGDMVMLFLIQGVSSLIFSYINKEELTIFFALGGYLLLRFSIYPLRTIIQKYRYIIIIGVITRIVLRYNYIFSLDFVINFSIMVLIFIIIKNFFMKIADKTFYTGVFINKLKPGMVWDKYLIDDGTKIMPMDYYKKNMQGKIFLEPSIEGLTREDIRRIKDAYKNNRLNFEWMDIPSKTCFAPFLFAATIVTMVLGGSLLTYIFPFLN